MIKRILLFFVLFVIAVFTVGLFYASMDDVFAKKSPVILQNNDNDIANTNNQTPDGEILLEIVEHNPESFTEIPSNIIEEETKVLHAQEEKDTIEPITLAEYNKDFKEIPKTFSFAVIADAETYKTPSRHNDILEHIIAKSKTFKPDFALFTGDILVSDFPDKPRLQNVKNLIEKYYDDYYTVIGKHDIECGLKCIDAWQEVFYDINYEKEDERILYHSFDYENTHFVLLSSEYPIKHSVDNKQLAWLDEDLANTDKDHIIVASHVPPVNFFKKSAKECHDMTCSEPQRTKLINILKKHRVDLVISGHEHVFDHKIVDGIDFILAGNSGNGKRYKNSTWEDSFSLINVSQYGINLRALGADGHLIREIKIK
ncbi:MAG: metallophosphoesterase [Patescibacteria group bacterium]